jgi:predicted ATPase/DNA-binding winged helix-turn-helix (wHTH) protein
MISDIITAQETARTGVSVSFGPFRLAPAERRLEKAGVAVPLGGRALDILIVLVNQAGEVVGKRELIERVWPDVTVDEGSLRFHVGVLRKALGDRESGAKYVTNVPGRGYCFVAPVSRSNPQMRSSAESFKSSQPSNLPPRLTRMVGRDETAGAISAQLAAHRFVTIFGPGGIGKTTVAVSVAHGLLGAFDERVRFVDLGTLTDPRLVAAALASAVGLSVNSEDPTPGLIGFLRDKRMLLVLDSCEHVIDAVAALGERVFLEAPQIHILATSREALRVEGETVYRLFPLDYPPDDAALTAAEALGFPAVQLFAERVAASANLPRLTDEDARNVAEICRKLDGIALAIELAAGRVAAYGIQGTAALLEDRFGLLTQGRRTAPPRLQTLNATFDWSYDLLRDHERLTLRRLAVFVGPFTLDAARSIAAADVIDEAQIVEAIGSLVDKSLVALTEGGPRSHYRLLDTTRAYSMEKLVESGELAALARRHALYYRSYFEPAEAERGIKPKTDWLTRYEFCLENVRAALNWCFSPSGDARIGVALVVVAIPLWFELSLLEECRRRTEQALASPRDPSPEGPRHEMRLLAALGGSLQGPGTGQVSTWAKLLEVAERLEDTDYQLRALWGLWIGSVASLNYPDVLTLARRFYDVALNSADPADIRIGDRLLGTSLHWCGEQAQARFHLERMLGSAGALDHRSQIVRFQFDQPIAARTFLCRVLCLQGFPEQAMINAERCIQDALSLGHVLSLCHTLMHAACPISIFIRDLAAGERFATDLSRLSAGEGLKIWNLGGRASKAIMLIEHGDFAGGLPIVQATLDKVRATKVNVFNNQLLGALAEGFGYAGLPAPGLVAVNEALAQSEETDRWYIPELLRIKGDLTLRQGDPIGAERLFEDSLDLAGRQGALWWQLRTSTNLAMMLRDQGRSPEALDGLGAIYDRFTEGFSTAHLRSAKALIESLRDRLDRGRA